MRVKIGPYLNYYGSYNILKSLKHIGVSENTIEYLDDHTPKWIVSFLEKIHSMRQRKVVIHIDEYDAWNANQTMAMIIVPILIKLKNNHHGFPARIYSDYNISEEDDDATEKADQIWVDILYKMIWAFQQQMDDDWQSKYILSYGEYHFEKMESKPGEEELHEMKWDKEPVVDHDGIKLHQKKIDEGLQLFAKYYDNLWD